MPKLAKSCLFLIGSMLARLLRLLHYSAARHFTRFSRLSMVPMFTHPDFEATLYLSATTEIFLRFVSSVLSGSKHKHKLNVNLWLFNLQSEESLDISFNYFRRNSWKYFKGFMHSWVPWPSLQCLLSRWWGALILSSFQSALQRVPPFLHSKEKARHVITTSLPYTALHCIALYFIVLLHKTERW